jgi:hypothetical protein
MILRLYFLFSLYFFNKNNYSNDDVIDNSITLISLCVMLHILSIYLFVEFLLMHLYNINIKMGPFLYLIIFAPIFFVVKHLYKKRSKLIRNKYMHVKKNIILNFIYALVISFLPFIIMTIVFTKFK